MDLLVGIDDDILDFPGFGSQNFHRRSLRQPEKAFIGQYHLEGLPGIKPLSYLTGVDQPGDKNQQGD